MMISKISRRKRGTSIVETAAGLFIIIPIVLFLFDVAAAVLAQTANDSMCKSAARAAAETDTAGKAQAAAQTAVDRFPAAGYITSKRLFRPVQYNAGTSVTVVTEIVCKFPVPIPFGGPDRMNFVTDMTEPVVGQL